MRRHFMRRIAFFLGMFFLLLFGVSALAIALASRAIGRAQRGSVYAPALLGLVILAVLLVTLARAVRRMAAPLGDVMEAADRVSKGDYAARVDARGPREVRALGRSFNAMAEQLQATEQQRRNLLADLAHELRTPLSIVRANVEGMLDGMYPLDADHLSPIVEETKVMERLLEDLQTLSSADVGALRLHRESVEPAALVEEAAAAFRAAADSAGVSLMTSVAPGLQPIEVDPIRVGEVFANLLSNSLRHTPSGGSIVISTEHSRGGVRFTVSDTGRGIPADELEHVFERFVTSGGSRGAGLGLAIAKALVEAHGGTIEAASEPGGGTQISLLFR